jgi:hypothetical protein
MDITCVLTGRNKGTKFSFNIFLTRNPNQLYGTFAWFSNAHQRNLVNTRESGFYTIGQIGAGLIKQRRKHSK